MTRRSLLPREHGAYVQLLAPLVAALLAFGAAPPAILLAIGAVLAFVANEPLLVVLGHRGRRMREQDGPRARRMLALLVPAAIAAGASGLALAPQVVPFAAIVAVPAGALVVLAWRKQERSLLGELIAAIALAGAAAPVAIAAGARADVAATLWLAWSIGYACTVIAVHRVIARHKRGATRRDLAISIGVAAVAIACVLFLRVAAPLAVASALLLVVAPSARYLRPIGFALLGASLISVGFFVHLVH